VPVAVLLAICALQLVTGWLAGRPMTVPSGLLLSPVAQGG
jgi:hypothetical protein